MSEPEYGEYKPEFIQVFTLDDGIIVVGEEAPRTIEVEKTTDGYIRIVDADTIMQIPPAAVVWFAEAVRNAAEWTHEKGIDGEE